MGVRPAGVAGWKPRAPRGLFRADLRREQGCPRRGRWSIRDRHPEVAERAQAQPLRSGFVGRRVGGRPRNRRAQRRPRATCVSSTAPSWRLTEQPDARTGRRATQDQALSAVCGPPGSRPSPPRGESRSKQMAGPVGELLRTDFSAPSTGHRAPSTLTGAVPMRTVSEPLSTKLPVLSTSHPGWGRGHGAATRANGSVNVGPSSQRRLRAHGCAPPPGGDASPERSPHADRRRAAQHQALSAASGPPWVGRAHGAAKHERTGR